jgi:hypothetical protein
LGNWLKLKTLIVGCSFCSTLGEQQPNQWTLNNNITVAATSGTGNQAMAARVLYECAENSYDRVIVIWTGINRLDTVITRALHETYPGAWEGRPDYSFCTPIKGSVWYHAGGQAGSWTWDKTCPADIRQIFKTQYLGADARYMSDISLSNIAYTQSFLEKQKINYQMSFIYNPLLDYCNTPHEHHFGTIDQSSSYYKLVDWDKIKINNTAFEWAKTEPNALEPDQLHPTRDAMKKWIDLTFGIDISA